MKQYILLLSAILLMGASASAQGKAKITIRKNIDGEETVIEREMDIEEGMDIEELLLEEGVEIDFDFEENDNARILEIIVDEEMGSAPFKFQAGCHGGKRAFLGVHSGGPSEGTGARVGEVIEGSSAEEMGLQEGDLITEFNGEKISSFGELRAAVMEAEAGEEVQINLERDGKRKKVKGSIGEKDHGDNAFYWMDGNDFHYEFDEEKLSQMLEELELDLEGLEDGQNFHFEFDSDDMEAWGEEFAESMEAWSEEFGASFDENYRSRTVVIIMEDISTSEADAVNEGAEPKLSLDNDLDLGAMRFFPNPGDGNFNLSFDTPERGDLNLMIFDGEGKKVYYEMLGDFQGRYENEIDISRRPAGNYFLQIEQGGKTYSRKIVKE
jgi:hypothetical protein